MTKKRSKCDSMLACIFLASDQVAYEHRGIILEKYYRAKNFSSPRFKSSSNIFLNRIRGQLAGSDKQSQQISIGFFSYNQGGNKVLYTISDQILFHILRAN